MDTVPIAKIQSTLPSTTKKFEHININDAHDEKLTFGQRIADQVAAIIGSWNFIITQSIVLVLWILINSIAWISHYDNYPYILLNLCLSFQAAYAAPIIMMSQNRQATKDRIAAEHDYEVNVKAEQDILVILRHLDEQDKELDRKVDMLLAAIDKVKAVGQ